MPLITQPAEIAVSDFTGGWAPDGAIEAADPSTLTDVNNVLIDRSTGSLETRKGFKRLTTKLSSPSTGHYIKQIRHFRGQNGYIICVVTDGTATADNVQLWYIKLTDGSSARFDTAGVTWANATAMFWFQAIDNVLYGGSRGNEMFSWDGTTYDGSAATNTSWKTLVDAVDGGVTPATQFGRNYAFKGTEHAIYLGDVFTPNLNIRYDTWESGQGYAVGDKVSRKSAGYFKSFKCILAHDAAAGNAPDDGGSWATYWHHVRLPLPRDEDGDVDGKWTFIPSAAKTSVSAWFADRLFLRFDGQGDMSRLQYSAPVKPNTGQDIPDVVWDPTDWAPGNDIRGQGGGWEPFNDGKRNSPITALHTFGQYLVVFKRETVWVLSGQDDTSWTVRRIGVGAGAYSSHCVTEVDGLLYFLSDDGLHVTDGTAEREAPGNQKVARWFRARLNAIIPRDNDHDGHAPTLFQWNGFVGISMPNASDTTDPHLTIFYDPTTQSYWKTSLPVLFWAERSDDLVARMGIFARAPESTSSVPTNLVYVYDHASAGDQDDDGNTTTPGVANIAWSLTTAWLPFGTSRAERRIRRIWWVVKGAISMTITQYRNWGSSAAATTVRTATAAAGHIEGAWMPDSHSMQMKLSAASAPAQVYGYAVDTEPRRERYHT
jgi:hypothetical protein